MQRHTDINLITPENLQIKGALPVGNRVLETSKALGLNYVVVGKLVLSEQPNFVLKLYHVDTGALLQQKSIRVSNPDELLVQVPPILDDLLVPILNTSQNETAPDIIVNFSVSPLDNTLLFIDGKVTCQEWPCAIKTKQGSHNIQFHNPYYEIWVEDRYLEPGAEINATLDASFGTVSVDSEPRGIQFQIDGISLGKTPLLKHKIEQGEHEVSILDPCFTGKDQTFTISNSENERIKLVGIDRTAGIDVFLENPTQKAKVYIDEQFVGNTPLSTRVPICSKLIRVDNEYGYYEGALNLREAEVEKLEVALKKRSKKRQKKQRQSKDSKRPRTRRINPTHAVWSTYTLQYGLDSGDFRLGLGTFQTKSGRNDSFIAPILPALRGQLLDYSVNSYNRHHLFPIGIGYALDLELGLLQPYYQWQWLSITELDRINEGEDLLTETTYTPNIHKVGLDFILNHSPLQYRSGHKGGTLQAQVSYLYCGNEPSEYCREELFIGASLYLLSGRWGF